MTKILHSIYYHFRRFTTASILNFIGLVITMLTFFNILVKVDSDYNYNSGIKDWRDIYRVEVCGRLFTQDSVAIANIFAPMMKLAKETDGVRDASLITLNVPNISFQKGDETFSIPYQDGYGKTLSFWNEDIKPQMRKKSKEAFYIYVPRSFAKQMFGKTDPIGKEISWQIDTERMTGNIACVYDDFPENCDARNAIYKYDENVDSAAYHNFNYHIYVKADKSDLARIERHLTDTINPFTYSDTPVGVKLRWATEGYFTKVDINDHGNMTLVVILFLSALFIVSITSFNYINFSLAIAPMRIRDINTRRVFGASKTSLRLWLMAENIVVSLVAFIVSVLILLCLSMFFGANMNPLHYWYITLLTLLASIGIGVISGIYPAFYITSFPMSMALKGTFSLTRRVKFLRNLRTAFQLLCSFVVIGLVMTIQIQGLYVYNTHYGYEKERMLCGPLNSAAAMQKRPEVAKVLEAVPGVQSVSFSQFELGKSDLYMMWSRYVKEGEPNIVFTAMPVDYKYMKTLGIKILEGRDFEPSDTSVFIINKAFADKYNWAKVGEDIDMNLNNGSPELYKVVGVCENIQFSSFRIRKEQPLAFVILGKMDSEYYHQCSTINIRLTDDCDINTTTKAIRKAYHTIVPKEDVQHLANLKNGFRTLYQEEATFARMMAIISEMYVLITLIGVFCQTMFECEYRRKEIRIRRVFGASALSMMYKFCKRYIIMAVVCFIPAAFLIGHLSTLVLKSLTVAAPMRWLAYPLTFIIVSGLTVGTAMYQSYKTSKEKIV